MRSLPKWLVPPQYPQVLNILYATLIAQAIKAVTTTKVVIASPLKKQPQKIQKKLLTSITYTNLVAAFGVAAKFCSIPKWMPNYKMNEVLNN
jgi:hypothetical protein